MFFQSNDFLHLCKLSSMGQIDGNIREYKDCLSVQIFFSKNKMLIDDTTKPFNAH